MKSECTREKIKGKNTCSQGLFSFDELLNSTREIKQLICLPDLDRGLLLLRRTRLTACVCSELFVSLR